MRNKIDLYVIQQVKERRIKAGLSQEALSYALNYTHSFISSFENKGKKYNLHHLNEIAKVLNCSPKDFLPQTPV